MLTATAVLVGLAVGLAALLVASSRLLRADDVSVTDEIERLLPRIQCGQCGYPGCRPYAEAISAGETEINQCPPGGEATIRQLARLLGREPLELDTSRGQASTARVAVIDEAACIGCNLCLRACPVDAIVGVSQFMHTVIAEHCTGCELCLPACPVDCIHLVSRRARISA